MAKKVKPCCANLPSQQSVRETLEEFEDGIERSFMEAKKLGARWDFDADDSRLLVVTWPSTNAYRNSVARGLVYEHHAHMRIVHKVTGKTLRE
jgi:hypothetical protein